MNLNNMPCPRGDSRSHIERHCLFVYHPNPFLLSQESPSKGDTVWDSLLLGQEEAALHNPSTKGCGEDTDGAKPQQ